MSDLTHQNVRGYEIRESLGAGGFGQVYRAYQGVVGREVAIKIILPQYANQPDFILRFETEAQLVARLEHIHIVPLYDYWRDPKGAYLVMRWLQGGSLRALLKRGALTPEHTAHLLDQITSALSAAHRRGVIHRDLKPDNILLDEEGNTYLADFGIAKDVRNTAADPTQGNLIVGSPAYLSPEQITGEAVTPRTDIYSLGVMIYELLTGDIPFGRLSTSEMLQKHLYEALPRLEIKNTTLPSTLDSVIQKATAKSPSDRYQDAPSVAVAFREAIQAVKDAPPRVYLPRDGGGTAQTSEDSKTFVSGMIQEKPTLAPETRAGQPTPKAIPAYEDTRESEPTIVEAIPTIDIENPYKGLRAFQQADAADFFGRDSLIDQLVERLRQENLMARFLAVVGPSGSGKSSAVRAGLLPALRNGALPGSQRWFLVEMIPGPDPIEQVAEALSRVATNPAEDLPAQLREDEYGLLRAVNRIIPPEGDTQVVLVIDQFEEVFTLLDDEAQRSHLLKSLLAAATDPASNLRVIITLRADFYDRPLLYPEFGDLIRKRTEVVLPLNDKELEQAIVGPARRVGINLEPGLVKAIISDVGEQPGALPLLQYALTELFERREGNLLTTEAYRNSGGVLGALARRAEELYDELSPAKREAARQLFLRLVTLGEGTEDTRRRASITELAPANGNRQAIDSVVDLFGRYRLLTFDRDPATRAPTVEIAHEALIRTWERLRGWLAESRDDLRLHQRLAATVAEWTAAGRDPSFLASGARLDQFEGWAAETTLALNAAERAYLDASVADREARRVKEEARKEHEARLERRSRNFLRALVVILLVATLGALGLSGLAVNQQQLAVANANTATIAQGLAVNNAATSVSNANTATVAQGLAVNNAATSVSNANTATVAQGQAVAAAATSQSNFVRAESQRLAAEAVNVMQASEGSNELGALLSVRAITMNYSPQADLSLIRATMLDYAVRGFNHGGKLTVVQFSPDGKYVLTGGEDGVARLWDTQTGQAVREFKTPEVGGGLTMIWTAAFSPDGRYLLTSSAGARLLLWDVQTGKQAQQYIGGIERAYIAFSPDGRTFLSSGPNNAAILWDVESGSQMRTLTGHTDVVGPVAFSPDGQSALTGSDDKTARIWDLATGKQKLSVADPVARIAALALSPDGKTLATGGSVLILWDAQTGAKVRERVGSVASLALSPDGKSILLGETSRTAHLWSVQTGVNIRTITGHTDVVVTVALSRDGRLALTGGWDGMARLWDLTRNGPQARQLTGHTDSVGTVAYSSDGKFIVTGSRDKTVKLWDAHTGQAIRTFTGSSDGISSVAISPDGKTILTGIRDGSVLLWNAQTGALLFPLKGHTDTVRGAAFSPDGKYALTGSYDTTVRLWDTSTGQQVRQLNQKGREVLNVAYSPDGKTAVIGDIDGYARLLDIQTGTEIKAILAGSGDAPIIFGVAFSPDGQSIATASFDKTGHVFDVASGKERQKFIGHTDSLVGIAFSPDGKTVATTSTDGTARLWDVSTGKELRRFIGHVGQVFGVAFSPDGRTLVTTAEDHTARLWDVDYHDSVRFICSQLLRDFTEQERTQYGINGTEPTCAKANAQPAAVPAWTPIPLSTQAAKISIIGPPRELKGFTQVVWKVQFSPDGKYVLAGGDKSARLWDRQSGKFLREFADTKSVYDAMFSPDGKTVAMGNGDGLLQVFETETGKLIHKFSANASIASVAFSPDGKTILTGSGDKMAYLWDAQTGEQLGRFEGHQALVKSVAFSPDGKYVLTGSWDKTARLWDTQSHAQIRAFTGHTDEIQSVAFSPDGKYVLTGGGAVTSGLAEGDRVIRLWDVETGEVVRTFTGHANQVNSVGFSPDGNFIISGASDKSVRVWDVHTGAEVRRFSNGIDNFVLSAVFSPQADSVVAGVYGGKILVWDMGKIESTTQIATLTVTPTP